MSDSGGLYLWVTPAGGKLWRWAYTYGGKEKLMSFGKYPAVTLALARDRHLEGRKLLAISIDPMAQRKAEKTVQLSSSANSFQSVAARWLEHWGEGKSPRHVDSVRRRMAADILPRLGARPMAEIEAPEIEQRGARDIAKRALQTTGQVFRYGIAHGYAKRNPATDIRPGDILRSTPKTNYARIDAKELPNLLKRIEIYQGKHVTRMAMKLMAMTFLRTSELIEAQWAEFDLEAARWDIPAERMKMRTPHIVPLARQVLEVLDMLRDLTGSSEWLFPGERSADKSMSNNTILLALKRMGYHALYLEPRARMMQDWADFLERTQRGGKVLPLRGRVA
jgi:integrase